MLLIWKLYNIKVSFGSGPAQIARDNSVSNFQQVGDFQYAY